MIWGILFFVFGLCFGSFLNAFLYRYSTKEKLAGRSFCPACKHQLAWYDLVPVFSWFLLNRKCRYCKKQISVQYPIVELLTALTFTMIGLFSLPGKYLLTRLSVISTAMERSLDFLPDLQVVRAGARDDTLNIILLIILFAAFFILLAIATYDYKNKEIPNGFNFTFCVLAFSYLVLSSIGRPDFLLFTFYFLLAACVAFLFFFTFVFFSKETWMGGGDAKLAFGIGLLLGPVKTFIAILLASVIGSIYGIGSLAFNRIIKTNDARIRNKKGKSLINSLFLTHNSTHEIPFGPFLVLGTTIAFFFGSNIAAWYAKMFLGL